MQYMCCIRNYASIKGAEELSYYCFLLHILCVLPLPPHDRWRLPPAQIQTGLLCCINYHSRIYIYIYNKTSLNQPAMGPTLCGPFREVVTELQYVYGRYLGTEIKRSIQGSGRSVEVVG